MINQVTASTEILNLDQGKLDLARVVVVGVSGSGKSTFARELASVLDCEHIELDRLYWTRNWQAVETAEFRRRVAEAASGQRWIIDGNYWSKTRDLKYPRATTVIWLDLPFPTTFRQAVKRAMERIATQNEIWPGTGNRESIRRTFFSHDSILLWTMTSFRKVRRRYAKEMSNPDLEHLDFIRIRTRREAESFLTQCRSSRPAHTYVVK